MAKLKRWNEKIWFRCKECKDYTFRPMGTKIHSKKHNFEVKELEDISKYFSITKNPPKEFVEKYEARTAYKKTYNNKKIKDKREEAVATGKNYKCSKCGRVIAKLVSLNNHCRGKHHKSAKKTGYTLTDEPPTRIVKTQKKPIKSLISDEKIEKRLPRLLGIVDSKVNEDGIVVTAQIQVPKEFFAQVIIQTLV